MNDDNLAAASGDENDDARENDDGVAFYTELAQETGGPVLEIACGAGRVAIPIARLGLEVTGLDVMPQLLAQARRKSTGLPIRWIAADARDFDLGQRFRLVFLTGNAFQQFLANDDQDRLLRRAHAHLDDEGLFAFETRNPVWPTPSNRARFDAIIEKSRQNGGFFAFLEDREEEFPWQTYAANDGREISESLSQTYDPIAQILRLTSYKRWRDGDRERVKIAHESLRVTFPQELAALLSHHDFTIIHQYGDWDHSPLTPISRSNIVVCRKAPGPLRACERLVLD